MSQGWIAVFTGSIGEAMVVRSKLEARGIPAFMPDETMRTIGPLGDFGLELALAPSVLVPPSAVTAARACIDQAEEGSALLADERELPPDFFAEAPAVTTDLLARARTLSRCILWGAIFPLGAPFALWHIGPYLKTVERLGSKPPRHRTTVVAACLSPLNLLPFVVQIYLAAKDS